MNKYNGAAVADVSCFNELSMFETIIYANIFHL